MLNINYNTIKYVNNNMHCKNIVFSKSQKIQEHDIWDLIVVVVLKTSFKSRTFNYFYFQ